MLFWENTVRTVLLLSSLLCFVKCSTYFAFFTGSRCLLKSRCKLDQLVAMSDHAESELNFTFVCLRSSSGASLFGAWNTKVSRLQIQVKVALTERAARTLLMALLQISQLPVLPFSPFNFIGFVKSSTGILWPSSSRLTVPGLGHRVLAGTLQISRRAFVTRP